MTTVADQNVGGGKGKWRAKGARGSSWKLLWQVPLLLAGAVAFGYGVRAMVRTVKGVPFEEQAAGIRSHIEAGKYDQAIAEVNAQANYYTKPEEVAEMHLLAGDATYLAQKEQPAYVRENYERAANHYKNAVAWGLVATPEMNERWGESLLAIGDGKMAIEKLEAAIGSEPGLLGKHVRDLVAAYLAVGSTDKASGVVDRMLKGKDLVVDDRSWGVCKKIEIAMGAGGGTNSGLEKVIAEARGALKDIAERDPAARVLTWIGWAEFEMGKLDEAKRDLDDARGRFVVHGVDDGRAAILLGKIAESKGDLEGAAKYYDDVVGGQTGTSVWAAGRLGRAEVAAMTDATPEQMKGDYRFVIQTLLAQEKTPRIGDGENGAAEMVSRDQVRASLVSQYQKHAEAGKLDEAMVFLALQGELKEKETAETVYRWATTKEQRGEEMLEEVKGMPETDVQGRAEKTAVAMGMLREAAEAYAKHSKVSTMEDTVSGNSLWRAAQLFDQAGEPMKSAELYERFTIERPRDPRVPEGLLAMGRLYESVGKLEMAAGLYERNRTENPRTPSAYRSAVNAARVYMAMGIPPQENFVKAEGALLSLVQENPDLRPDASEFRDSVMMLGELYYRNGRWADAILRLEEAVARYPDDKEMPRVMFLLAESYRKSGAEIGVVLAKDGGIDGREELAKARRDRLEKAAGLFGRVIDTLDVDPDRALAGNEPKLTPLEDSYLRSSYMDRGECYFDLGDYATAIKMYDLAATRFSQRVTAIEAYVQIVNCYTAMKDPQQATAAAERAQWALKRIPEEEFGKGALALNRQYYEELLQMGKK